MADIEGPVVSDTTSLINLVGVGLLDLLPQLYTEVWVADAVYLEYTVGMRPGDPDLSVLGWLQIIQSVPLDPSLPTGLGAGEAE